MKRLLSFVATLSILAFGCGAGADGTASPTAEVTSTPGPATVTLEAGPASTPVPTIVSVTWDGTTCDYRGPAVFPRDAAVNWLFANIGPAVDDARLQPWLLVMAVKAGTTWDDVREAEQLPASGPPPSFADLSEHFAIVVPGDNRPLQMSGDEYYVGCFTAPALGDRITTADLVYVIGR